MTTSGPPDWVCTTGTGVAWPHQLPNASVVELNVETPQFKVVVSGVVVASTPGPAGLKLLGTYGNVPKQVDPVVSQPLAAFPSQSSVPPPQAAQAPAVQVWAVVQTAVVQVVPQDAFVSMGFSQPFAADPSQLRTVAPQATQAPLVQVCVSAAQATAEPHWPLPLHVCTPLPEHCVVPGVHTPVQAPETHAEETHAVPVPHWPAAVQVSRSLPEHLPAPGAQTPVQLPLTQACPLHAVSFTQSPWALQVWGCRPTHCFVPGVQVPEQAPALQASGQGVSFCQAPFALQSWGVTPLHCLAPGAHTPVQTAPTHA